MRLLGVVCSYREGGLIRECIRSLLEAVEFVVCYEGPFGDAPEVGTESDFTALKDEVRSQRLLVKHGRWASQAAKLTELTKHCQRFAKPGEPLWLLHLDGDEVLLWGRFLRDLCERFTEELPDERFINVKLVELDGTVGGTQTHLIRGDLIDHYLVSGSQILFKGDSFPLSLHNPDGDRFPIQGEPHILHRSALRSRGRDAKELRAHMSEEAAWFERAAREAGVGDVA